MGGGREGDKNREGVVYIIFVGYSKKVYHIDS